MANEHWYTKAASIMARTGMSLIQVSTELGLGLTVRQAERIQLEPEFTAVLRGERFKYYAEIQRDPSNTKASLIGRMHNVANELNAKKAYKDEGTVLIGIAKVEGWMTDNTQVTVFGDVSAADITKMKASLEKAKESQKVN